MTCTQQTLSIHLYIHILNNYDFVPQTPGWDFAAGPHWQTSVPQTHCLYGIFVVDTSQRYSKWATLVFAYNIGNYSDL